MKRLWRRRIQLLIFIGFGLLITSSCFAAEEYTWDFVVPKPSKSVWEKIGKVMARGFLNAITLPFEVPRTLAEESEIHPRLWPITFLPRGFTHIMVRAASSVNDVVFYPLAAPFMDEMNPWTDHFGLPRYPWQLQPTQ